MRRRIVRLALSTSCCCGLFEVETGLGWVDFAPGTAVPPICARSPLCFERVDLRDLPVLAVTEPVYSFFGVSAVDEGSGVPDACFCPDVFSFITFKTSPLNIGLVHQLAGNSGRLLFVVRSEDAINYQTQQVLFEWSEPRPGATLKHGH